MIREFTIYSDDGALIKTITTKDKFISGNWVMFAMSPLKHLVKNKGMTPAALKIFMFLASKQSFTNFIHCTALHIEKELKMSHGTVSTALKLLREKNYVISLKVEGQVCFLLNPGVTTRGKKSMSQKAEIWELIRGGAEVEVLEDNRIVIIDTETGEVSKSRLQSSNHVQGFAFGNRNVNFEIATDTRISNSSDESCSDSLVSNAIQDN